MAKEVSKEILKGYLNYFEQHGHKVVPSSPLIPENDPTTLFTGSGMQPMVPYLLGQKHPLGTRITDIQWCFRTQDIEEVGDNRHTTFFGMLGNWSLGDYFKKEQIQMIFEYMTKIVGLDPNRIYVTVFRGNEALGIGRDAESVETWKRMFESVGIDAKDIDYAEKNGMQGGRIFYYSESKNWWSRSGEPSNMPIEEPGGPDSEMFWDFGEELELHESSPWKNEPCHVNCDCGRFLEIGNSVFMQYIKTEEGFKPLPQQNVDFGGGLERITAALNDNADIFTTDIFEPIRQFIEKQTNKKYGENLEHTKAFRIVMDHMRAATFLISNGVVPSNKDQGYFVRRLIRRAIRFAHKLDVKDNFTSQTAEIVIDAYKDLYSKLEQEKSLILSEFSKEEIKFRKTLENGLKEFEKAAAKLESGGEKTIPGEIAFRLYDTFGFPIELTQELADERELKVDVAGFEEKFKAHQELSRAGSEQKFKGGLADHSEQTARLHTATHLLLAGLRKFLGPDVWQKGSNITAERLRFDFSYPQKLTPEQLKEVEDYVNEAIKADVPVNCIEMDLKEAKASGAIGVFDEKYEEKVKVYTIDGFSKEICGGPHAIRTGDLKSFKIVKEEASSAGVRRIKAVIGP